MGKRANFNLDALDSTPLGLVKPMITDAVLARTCELLGLDGDDREEILAVMLARSVNPALHLNNELEGSLRQMGRKAVGRAKARGDISGV